MVFFVLFIILLILSFTELITKQKNNLLFTCLFALVTLLSAFRFGVGTDYFQYMQWYNLTPKFGDPSYFSGINSFHGEIGYKLMGSLFKTLGMNYYAFIFVFTCIIMSLFYLYISRQSKLKITSLFIFYCNLYYFSFVNGQIRQAFTLGFFLAVLFPLLLKKKYFKYIIYTLLASSIHTSILVVLVLPLIFFKFNLKNMTILLLSAVLIGLLGLDLLRILLPGNIYNAVAYYGVGDANILAILSRLAFLFLILILIYIKNSDLNNTERQMLRYYLIGVLLYFSFFNMPLVSSRTNIYFKAFEIVLIPNLCSLIGSKAKRIIIVYSICILMSFLWLKEIQSQLTLGSYYNRSSVLKYDYISIFNKDDILKYRPTIDLKGRGVESY